MPGKKRTSPGAEEVKANPFDVEISDEVHAKLKAIRSETSRVELAVERLAQKKLRGVYEKRRDAIKTVPKFWAVALMNNATIAMCTQHKDDQKVLLHLEDVWVERDAVEPRAFKIEFHFSENPYFSDKVLVKDYKYMPPPVAADDKPDEDGITETMLEFEWERDVEPQAFKINWKDDSKNLVKLYPRLVDDGEVEDPGSFFNFFETAKDELDVGIVIANEIFPEAIDWFTGTAAGAEIDSEEEESEDDEDDEEAEEIDLEAPKTKRQKKV